MSDDVKVFSPNPDDSSFYFKSIQKGYAAVALSLPGGPMRQAVDCYRKLAENPAIADTLGSESTGETLKKHLSKLRRNARFWQKEMSGNPGQFQREYASIVKMAHDDCIPPLAAVQEAADTLHRALEDTGPAASARAVAGVSENSLKIAYAHMNKLRKVLQSFTDTMRPIFVEGSLVAGSSDDNRIEEMLARPIQKRDRNPDYEQEVMFLGLIGILESERPNVLAIMEKMPKDAETTALTEHFAMFCGTLASYAKYGIEDPKRAITLMQRDIPGCLEALRRVKQHQGESEFGLVDVLEHCIGSLQQSGPGEDRAKK